MSNKFLPAPLQATIDQIGPNINNLFCSDKIISEVNFMVYKRIRDLRELRNLNQKQVGQILNIAQRTYSRYENGESTIPLKIFIKLAEFHDTSVDYLLGRTDAIEPYPKN